MSAKVFLEALEDGAGEPAQMLKAAKAIGLDGAAQQARTIFIKPNLTYPVYKEGVTTRQSFVRNLVFVLKELNPDLHIYVGEGEGGYNSFSMLDAMRHMGFFELTTEFSGVEIINLSKTDSRIVQLDTKHGPYDLALPEIFFNEIDFSISCPLPKVHCMTGITLSFKNQWGCLPDMMRLKNHFVFNEIICQVCDILKFQYAFLDGKIGLDDNGPMMGTPVEVNWFAASNNLGAFDAVVADLMGVDWRTIGHLQEAHRKGFIPDQDQIHVQGDPESLRRQFTLKRSMWNYPALAAFHSKNLTHLFYFSKWADFLHKVMYTFRKRPIDPFDQAA